MKRNWINKRIGDFCNTGAGGTPLKSKKEYYKNGTIPFLKSGEVCVKNIHRSINRITNLGLEGSSAKIFSPNTVVVAMYGATAGQAGILRFRSATNQAICGIFPNDEITPEFLYYFLLYKKNDLVKQAVGNAQPNISQRKIRNLRIPIPPLPEQRRIVALLDQVFEAIDKANEKTEKNIQSVQELFESYLQSVFSDNGDDWEEKMLGDKSLLEIVDGDRGKNYPKKGDYFKKNYCLFLNTKNVRPNGFDFNEKVFISKQKDNDLGKGKLQRNDVILTTRGTIGNVAVYDEKVDFEHVRINSGMLIFRPNLNMISPKFLFEVIRSNIFKKQISEFVSGAAQPQLPIKTLVNFKIPVPKMISVQKEIVIVLFNLYGNIVDLKNSYIKKLKFLQELKQSILHKAFTGEL